MNHRADVLNDSDDHTAAIAGHQHAQTLFAALGEQRGQAMGRSTTADTHCATQDD